MAQAVFFQYAGSTYKDEYNQDIFGNGTEDKVVEENTVVSINKPASTDIDRGVIYLEYNSLTINENKKLYTNQRNAGLIIRVKHDCTINGTIQNCYAPRALDDTQLTYSGLSRYYPSFIIKQVASSGSGGSSGYEGWTSWAGSGGDGQSGHFYGGGYGGGGGGGSGSYSTTSRDRINYGGNGGSAAAVTYYTSIFQGGSSGGGSGSWGGGGGGANSPNSYSGCYSGAGGSGPGGTGGSSVGATSYSGNTLWAFGSGGGAGNYGGGVIIIYCGGILTVNGSLDVHGQSGGAGGSKSGCGDNGHGGNGGSGGGGRVFVMAKTLTQTAATIKSKMNCSPIQSTTTDNVKMVYTLDEYIAKIRG